MPKNKKKWIDKRNAVTFHLVHRSQQDPLTADESAPQRVLLAAAPAQGKLDKKKEEERKYGIYFDDGYDYLQHLRDTGTGVANWEQTPQQTVKESRIKLPSSVFASEVEEDVGLLNRAAPQSGLRLDLDPDIVAAMDEDFDFSDPENELEDDFILKANALEDEQCIEEEEEGEGEEGEYEDDSEDGCWSEEMNDSVHSLDLEETKSRFTEFSMSSSVVPRNDQLTLLDDRFEKMFAEYDENEIGPLDCEEIEGDISPEDAMVLRLADEQFDQRSKVPDPEGGGLQLCSDSDDSSSIEDERLVPVVERDRWDCESVLSTYSNLYNHPKLISEPRINKIKVSQRTGMPVTEGRLTARNLATLDDNNLEARGPGSVVSMLSTLSMRDKDETPEQKKQRKAALRLYRKDRRVERKLNSNAFKEEKKRQEKNLMNTRACNVAVHNL